MNCYHEQAFEVEEENGEVLWFCPDCKGSFDEDPKIEAEDDGDYHPYIPDTGWEKDDF